MVTNGGTNLQGTELTYDDHTQPHSQITHGQLTLFLSCVFAFVIWIFCHEKISGKHLSSEVDAEKGTVKETQSTSTEQNGVSKKDVSSATSGNDAPTMPPVPSVNEIVKNVMLFGCIMFYFFLCDYVKIFPKEDRVYNRDLFLFLLFVLFLVACVFTITPTKDQILNRNQTEEWKGWMQVMFVWYHYFAAKEWYNWIRVYIACYVWMTGFGNFSFFWVKGDYSLWRVLKMLFRMNFLVIAVVMATANEYMLYYICAMHTYWFITVYIFMRILSSWNTHRWKMAAKYIAYIAFNAFIFEIPGMCSTLFRPLWFIFQFHFQEHDIMYEWEFRAGLDHWACLLGMLCAYNYPHFEAFLKYLESNSDNGKQTVKKVGIKLLMVGGGVMVGVGWYFMFMREKKYEYNHLHCYSSLLPILVFVLLRNAFPTFRRYYIGLFASLGKITLETYLSQLHVYLQSNAKHRISYIGGHPLLNLALSTFIYLGISRFLFNQTILFSAFFVQKDWRKALRLSGIAGGVIFVSFLWSCVLKLSVL